MAKLTVVLDTVKNEIEINEDESSISGFNDLFALACLAARLTFALKAKVQMSVSDEDTQKQEKLSVFHNNLRDILGVK